MIRLHDDPISGNGYKVRLMLALLGIPYDYVAYDIVRGETRTPEFLRRRNANGRIPVLELEDGTHVPESNAILVYLADGTPYWPDERLLRTRALQWMFFEQYSHEPNIATRRFWMHLPELSELQRVQLQSKLDQGHAALGVMEKHLRTNDWFAGEQVSVADIALFAYTHVADEGGFDLAPYAAVNAWLDRVRALPGYVPMASPGGRT